MIRENHLIVISIDTQKPAPLLKDAGFVCHGTVLVSASTLKDDA